MNKETQEWLPFNDLNSEEELGETQPITAVWQEELPSPLWTEENYHDLLLSEDAEYLNISHREVLKTLQRMRRKIHIRQGEDKQQYVFKFGRPLRDTITKQPMTLMAYFELLQNMAIKSRVEEDYVGEQLHFINSLALMLLVISKDTTK